MGIILAGALGLLRFSFEASDLHDRARTLLERGRHKESARLLRMLLAERPDEPVKLGDGRYLGSVVAALETARSLPARLEEELLFFAESEAKSLLPEVVPDDPSLLERAAAYFPAPTAARALHLLAILELDKGHRASAARHLRRVIREPALASAARSRLRSTRWRPPPAPERVELAPKWMADVGGADALLASGTLVLSGVRRGRGLAAVRLETGELLARSGGGEALCADGPRVFVEEGLRLHCLDARTLSESWCRRSPRLLPRHRSAPRPAGACSESRLFWAEQGQQGNALVCLDARTGRELWKTEPRTARTFCGGRRVYVVDADGGLTAFDASSGRAAWGGDGPRKEEPSPGRRGEARATERFSAGICSGLVIRTGAGLRPAALDPLDGTEVWTYPEEGALYAGEACGLCILRGEVISAVDPASGELVWQARPDALSESGFAGWKGAIVSTTGGGLVAWSAAEGQPVEVLAPVPWSGKGLLIEVQGGVIAVGEKKTAFLCDAREELARLKAMPRSPVVSIQTAEILRLLGEPEEALKHLEWIGEEESRSERVRRRLVSALSRTGKALSSKPQLASIVLQRALRLSLSEYERASCLLSLAGLREAADAPAEAVAYCQRVMREAPAAMYEYDENLMATASAVAQHRINLICRDHGWRAYDRIEGKAVLSGLDARALHHRFPNSMEFCRRVAENLEDKSLVMAALSSLRWREDEEAKRLASLLRAAMSPEEPQYSGLERAWLIETRDTLLLPEGRPGCDPPVFTRGHQQNVLNAYDRVTGKLLWRRELPGQLLRSCWAGERLALLCRGTLAHTQARKDSVTVVDARWGRLAWSRRIPARWSPVKSQVLFSDGEYVIAGNEFGAVAYDARGGHVRELRGPVVGVEAGVALRAVGRRSAVELSSGRALLDAWARACQIRVFDRRAAFLVGRALTCVGLPDGRPLWSAHAPEGVLAAMDSRLVLLHGPVAGRALDAQTGEHIFDLPRVQSWASTEGWLACIPASGESLTIRGVPFGRGKEWRKEYAFPRASGTLVPAGCDGVLLWCAERGTRTRAVLLSAPTGEERGSVDLPGAEGAPERYAESVWGRVRGGIICLELTPAPDDLRRLARKGGEEFLQRIAGLFRPGLSRNEHAELTTALDMGRSGKKVSIRARRLQVNVDGELGEWKGADWAELSGLEHLWPDPTKSSSTPEPGGLSARAAVAWDARGMYVAVEVTDDVDAPGDAVELHLLPRTGTRFRTLGRRLRTRMTVRSRDTAAHRTRYEWGANWEALGVAEAEKPGPEPRSRRDFAGKKVRLALMDIVIRDGDGEGILWSLCLTGEAVGLYDRSGFAEVDFGE